MKRKIMSMLLVIMLLMQVVLIAGCGAAKPQNEAVESATGETEGGFKMTYELACQMNYENFGENVAYLNNSNRANDKYVEEGFIHMLDPNERAEGEKINFYGISHWMEITKSDGMTYKMYGVLWVPLDFDPAWVNNETVTEQYPTLVMCAGFCDGAMYWSGARAAYMNTLAPEGYIGYSFDFVGGSKNGVESYSNGVRSYCTTGDTNGETYFTQMSVMTEVEELHLMVDAIKELKYVDSEQIVLIGASQGSLVSGIVAAQREKEGKNDVAGLILTCPALCIPNYAYECVNTLTIEGAETIEEKVAAFSESPESYIEYMTFLGNQPGVPYYLDIINNVPYDEDLGYYSILPLMSGYTGSVLLIHGLADTAVLPYYSYDAVYGDKAVYSANVAELLLVTNAGHTFEESSSTPEYMKTQAYETALTYLTSNGIVPQNEQSTD